MYAKLDSKNQFHQLNLSLKCVGTFLEYYIIWWPNEDELKILINNWFSDKIRTDQTWNNLIMNNSDIVFKGLTKPDSPRTSKPEYVLNVLCSVNIQKYMMWKAGSLYWPLITCPIPTVNSKGVFLSREESNIVPLSSFPVISKWTHFTSFL